MTNAPDPACAAGEHDMIPQTDHFTCSKCRHRTVPEEIFRLAQEAIVVDELEAWWNRPHDSFEKLSPAQVWITGKAGEEQIREFIQGAKSGDMA